MRALVIVLALLVSSAGTVAQQPNKPKAVTHTVTIDATSFRPASLTVNPGDSVVWVNKDVIPHTATSAKSGVFDSGTIETGKAWKQTFTAKGEIPYVCQFHPTMKGTIRVR